MDICVCCTNRRLIYLNTTISTMIDVNNTFLLFPHRPGQPHFPLPIKKRNMPTFARISLSKKGYMYDIERHPNTVCNTKKGGTQNKVSRKASRWRHSRAGTDMIWHAFLGAIKAANALDICVVPLLGKIGWPSAI